MNNKKIEILLFILFISNIAFSQRSNVFLDKNETKYQIGIPANRVFNSVFPKDKYSYLIEVRFKKSKEIYYRFGADYNFDTSESGSYNGGIKIGIDKPFKSYNKWFFYYGVDLGYKHNYLKESKKHSGNVSLSPFLGIMFKLSKNFSISTEPNLYLATNFLIDNDTFNKDNKKVWVESGFSKVGFLQFNFHF